MRAFAGLAGASVALSFCIALAAGNRTSAKTWTEDLLNDHFAALKAFKAACGRFPTTREGLKALAWKPNDLTCPLYNSHQDPREGVLSTARDGWGYRSEYRSDGKHYRINGSHGYFLTDQSPIHGNRHWDNPKPPPEPTPKAAPGEEIFVR